MIDLIKTCGGCPEQYNAMKDNVQVGYLRLRHGHFYVICPDYDGEKVYEAFPLGDGIFHPEEREYYLSEAVKAIESWCSVGGLNRESNDEDGNDHNARSFTRNAGSR